jgi:hypothetical protein
MEVELSDIVEALDPSAQALAGISVTISRLFFPPVGKVVIPKEERSSILTGGTHISFASPNSPTLDIVGIGERGEVWDDIGTVTHAVTGVAAGDRVTVVGYCAILTVTVVVGGVGMATEKVY